MVFYERMHSIYLTILGQWSIYLTFKNYDIPRQLRVQVGEQESKSFMKPNEDNSVLTYILPASRAFKPSSKTRKNDMIKWRPSLWIEDSHLPNLVMSVSDLPFLPTFELLVLWSYHRMCMATIMIFANPIRSHCTLENLCTFWWLQSLPHLLIPRELIQTFKFRWSTVIIINTDNFQLWRNEFSIFDVKAWFPITGIMKRIIRWMRFYRIWILRSDHHK